VPGTDDAAGDQVDALCVTTSSIEADRDAVGQAELVAAGEVSALEMVDAAIERIEQFDSSLNAVIHRRFDEARAECAEGGVDGPFRGVPILLKDSAMMAGDPLHLGMQVLRDADHRSPVDHEFVAKLRRAGFVVVGRTNTPELLNQATTEPVAYGATKNPWDLGRTCGGSSGGSAAAVAARMVPVAHANDGGGSIRVPASVCGLVGLKASRGRVSHAPLPEAPHGVGVEGVVCRSVRDAAALLDVMAGAMPGDPQRLLPPTHPYRVVIGDPPAPLRVTVMVDPPRGLSTEEPVVDAVRRAACALESLGHVVTTDAPRLPSWERMRAALLTGWSVSTAALASSMERMIGSEIGADDLEPTNAALVAHAQSVTGLQLHATAQLWATVARALGVWWADGHDLLLTPVVRTVTPRLGEVVARTDDPLDGWLAQWDWIPFTALWNHLGNPAMSLPIHRHDDLPVGVQLVAAPGREDRLLQVAAQLEQALPWHDHRPPL
jgi:amidase